MDMVARLIKIIIIFPIFYICAQTESDLSNNTNYQLSSERYFSNDDGQIMMKDMNHLLETDASCSATDMDPPFDTSRESTRRQY